MMRYSLLIQGVVLLLLASSFASSEIFEQVNDYDLMAEDIRSADLNNDGLEDFAVADIRNDSSGYEVFLSNGDCSFDSCGWVFVDTAHIDQLLIEDWNEDGNHDLMLVGLNETWFLEGDGTGSFTNSVTYPWSLYNGCTADLNNDGHLDLVGVTPIQFVTLDSDTVYAMMGDGQGGFALGWAYGDIEPSPPVYCYYSVEVIDLDEKDTFPDLCIPSGSVFFVFHGTGDGSFITPPDSYSCEIPGWTGPYVCALGDYDEDGYQDLAMGGDGAMSGEAVYIFLNQQNGSFLLNEPGYFVGAGSTGPVDDQVGTADLDLDNHLDLMYNNAGGSKKGYGDGTFDYSTNLSIYPITEFALLDFDLDGDLDMVESWGLILRNTTIMQGIEGSSVTSPSIQVFPNPFSSTVVITTPSVSEIPTELRIYDLTGRLVSEISPETTECSTVYTWDGRSGTGEVLPCGVYSARLATGDTEQKLMILKL